MTIHHEVHGTGPALLLIHAGVADSRMWAAQRDDPSSILSLYRALIDLRRTEPALAVGDYAAIACREPVLAYRRALGDRRLLIALNLGSEPARLPLPPEHGGYQLVLSTKLDQGPSLEDGVLALRGDEGVILRAT